MSFFAPQSYWSQFANRLVDNVVGQVGGSYSAPSSTPRPPSNLVFKDALKELAKPETTLTDDKLEAFRKALKMENATRLQYSGYPEFRRKMAGTRNYVSVEDLSGERKEERSKTEKLRPVNEPLPSMLGSFEDSFRTSTVPTSFTESQETAFDSTEESSYRQEGSSEVAQETSMTARPKAKFWRENNRAAFIDEENQRIISSAEIVDPTKSPSSASRNGNSYQYYYSQQTTTTQSPSEYGVLPTLLLRNPNARTKFYHLDKYANPQLPIRKIIKPMTFAPPEFKGKDNMNPAVIEARKKLQEFRRKPARLPVSYTSREVSSGFDDSISNQIRFRSALKKILAEFRKTHPVSQRAKEREDIQLQRLAQQKAARTNRRRHPGQRRVVMLPARYESNEELEKPSVMVCIIII